MFKTSKICRFYIKINKSLMIKKFNLFNFFKKSNISRIFKNNNKISFLLINDKKFSNKTSRMENHQKICNECKGPLIENNLPDTKNVK